VLAFVLLAAIGPAPTPTPLKVITHVHASPVCSSLHDLVVPAAKITKQVQPLIQALEHNVDSIHRILRELGPAAGTGADGAGAIFLDRLTTLPIANAEWRATQILAKLQEIDKILAASYAQFPPGTNRNVDALRQRIQNLVDLQRAYANALRLGPAMVLDNMKLGTSDPNNPKAFGGGVAGDPSLGDNPGIKMEQATALAMQPSPDTDPIIAGSGPVRKIVAKDLRSVAPQVIAQNLTAEEAALVPAALAAIRDCDPAPPN
jgi:hypothetical protein